MYDPAAGPKHLDPRQRLRRKFEPISSCTSEIAAWLTRRLLPFFDAGCPSWSLQWRGYRKIRGIVGKRLKRRLGELGVADLSAYRDVLVRDPRGAGPARGDVPHPDFAVLPRSRHLRRHQPPAPAGNRKPGGSKGRQRRPMLERGMRFRRRAVHAGDGLAFQCRARLADGQVYGDRDGPSSRAVRGSASPPCSARMSASCWRTFVSPCPTVRST
jgi:hypothetical protein